VLRKSDSGEKDIRHQGIRKGNGEKKTRKKLLCRLTILDVSLGGGTAEERAKKKNIAGSKRKRTTRCQSTKRCGAIENRIYKRGKD